MRWTILAFAIAAVAIATPVRPEGETLVPRALGCDSAYCGCWTGCGGNAGCQTSCFNGHCANTFPEGSSVPSC
ncbi:hypothetical protein AA0120_g11552 [Alternaria tenuissima]|nr:hypothetical protein AA0120_g11552 [Alternaria tenuissima]RYO52817.1 hypothetical protein AA0116_g11726 [Alternaria tenuissima]